nr:hypothetical protein [Candidatus Electrothrix aestuarii]
MPTQQLGTLQWMKELCTDAHHDKKNSIPSPAYHNGITGQWTM